MKHMLTFCSLNLKAIPLQRSRRTSHKNASAHGYPSVVWSLLVNVSLAPCTSVCRDVDPKQEIGWVIPVLVGTLEWVGKVYYYCVVTLDKVLALGFGVQNFSGLTTCVPEGLQGLHIWTS
jgi:hypothetical protein